MATNPEEMFGQLAGDPARLRTMWVDVKNPALREMLGIPEGGMPALDFFGAAQAPPPAAPPVEPGFGTSVRRGWEYTKEDFANAMAVLTQADPETSQKFLDKAALYQQQAQDLPSAVPNIESITDFSSGVTWGTERLGELVPFIASIALPGLLTGGLASATGLAARGATALNVADKVLKSGEVLSAASRVARGAGTSAAFLADLGLMTGESAGIAQEQGGDIGDIRVLGSGLGKAVLDFIPFWTLAKTVGLAEPFQTAILKNLAQKGYITRVAGNAAALMASEVPTETLQEVINIELDNYFTGYTGPITEEQKSQLYNAAAAASLFGAFGLYAPKAPPPPGITEEPGTAPKVEPEVRLLTQDIKTDFKFDLPAQGGGNVSGFDFRNLYDAKTGEVKVPRADFMRIVEEQMQAKYDPLSDTVKQPPSQAVYTTIVPGWQQLDDGWYLDSRDGDKNGAKAQIVYEYQPGPSGWVQGFAAYDAYGNKLGFWGDLASAQLETSNGLMSSGKTFIVDQDGMYSVGEVDGHTKWMRGIPVPGTPTEMAGAAIQESMAQRHMSQIRGEEAAVSALVNNPDYMRLMEAREDFINDPDNYRSTDGELKKEAVGRLAAIDLRIMRYTDAQSILPKPALKATIDITGTNIDEKLGEVENANDAANVTPKYHNLNPFEQKEFDRLLEKDMYEGLTDRERDSLDRLMVKEKTGQDKFGVYVPPEKADQAELSQVLSEEEKQFVAKVRKKKYSKATRAIAKMRGIQLAKEYPADLWPYDHPSYKKFFQVLNERFQFTVDAAASAVNAKVKKFFGREQNGLEQSWAGERVWLNPPFNDVGTWAKKAYEESQKGATVVMLVPANQTSNAWWQDWVEGKARVEFLRGRQSFTQGERPLSFGTALVIYGEQNMTPAQSEPMAFAKEMSLLEAIETPPAELSGNWVQEGDRLVLYDNDRAQSLGAVVSFGDKWGATAQQGWTIEVDSKAKAMEWLLLQTKWAKNGWKITGPYVDEITAINPKKNAAILATEKGTYEAIRIKNDNSLWSLGEFKTPEKAMRVAEGQSSAFAQEAMKVLTPLWKSFNVRPKLYVVTTEEIFNLQLPEDVRERLLASHGAFMQGKPGTIYIHLDAHEDIGGVVKTLVHEMLGHFGLRATLSRPHWEAILYAYAQYNRSHIEWLEKKGLSEEGRLSREMGNNVAADILTADEAISYFAQESYSGNPLKPYEQTFWNQVVATMRSWFRWIATTMFPEKLKNKVLKALPFNEKDMAKLLNDSARMLREGSSKGVNTSYVNRNIIQSSLGEQTLRTSVDSFSDVWLANAAGLFLTPLQFAERYNIPGVQRYLAAVQRWHARKMELQTVPVELVKSWTEYPKAKAANLSQALLAITAASDKKIADGKGPLTEEERLKILSGPASEGGWEVTDEKGITLYNAIRDSFRALVKQMEVTNIKNVFMKETRNLEATKALYDAYMADMQATVEKKEAKAFDAALRKYGLEGFDFAKKIMKINAETKALLEREYFPYMRFGRYAIWIRANQDVYVDGKKYYGPKGDKRGQMIHFETFESYRKMTEALKDLEKQYPAEKGFKVGTGKVTDVEHTLLGMPPALYETLQEQMNLTEAQLETLKEIYFTKSPGTRFMRNMLNRKGIRGFSQDTIRVYASYMMNAAGHIARAENGIELEDSLKEVSDNAVDMGINAGTVKEYWAKHWRYIMNPENDWAGIRAVGFLWYLGFNVKSAAVNLTQVPMITYPYLAARFGDTKALAAITGSYKEAALVLHGKHIPIAELQAAIQEGINQGFLDEGLSTVLAGFAESSVLQRLAPETAAQQKLNQVAWAGSFMFRHVEQINRYTTFIAAWKLAKERGGDSAMWFAEAKEAVQSAMFEYAKWNRAPFSRGKKSVIFLFWSYMQNLAYLMAGGKGKSTAMRIWVMMLLAAGYQGIPFADNILDLIDWGSRQVRELLGLKDPYTDTRTALREFAQSITDNPDLLLHGWSKEYGLGPIHLLSLAGVPVPEVNLSGSMSVGRWLPGTESLTSTERDPDKKLGQTLVDVLGPVGGIGYGFWRALTDTNPDEWKKWERAMPSALKGASQGVRRWQQGAEEFRGGGALAEWDVMNPEDRTSLALNMLGFQPTRVGKAYEVVNAKESLRRYWMTRQAMVMENYAFAKRSGDAELMADARAAKDEFNEQVPDPRLRLTSEKIRQSMKARRRKIREREQGMPSQKGYRRLYEEIDQIYGLQ